MKSKFDKEANTPALRLLPNQWKKIGLGLIVLTVLTFIILIIFRHSVRDATQTTKDLIKQSLFFVFTGGLLIIAMARDKIEDELTLILRLKAMAVSFVGGITYGLVYPFVCILFGDAAEKVNSNELISFMLLFYIIMFSILKSSR